MAVNPWVPKPDKNKIETIFSFDNETDLSNNINGKSIIYEKYLIFTELISY